MASIGHHELNFHVIVVSVTNVFSDVAVRLRGSKLLVLAHSDVIRNAIRPELLSDELLVVVVLPWSPTGSLHKVVHLGRHPISQRSVLQHCARLAIKPTN